MSELVDKDAFLKQERKRYCEDCDRRKGVKNGRKCFVYEIGEVPCRACDVDDVLDDLEDFPTTSPWHRCEDELPEKEGDYLVWTMLYGGHAYTDYYTPKYGWDEYKVIAWMPLPEPPKEDA